MRFSRVIALFALAALPAVAFAGKAKEPDPLPVIVATGIGEFDTVFNPAKGIQDKLKAESESLKKARTDANAALEVATDDPLGTALAELKKKANTKLKVVMSGRMPKVSPEGVVPDNIQKGIDAVNGLVDAADGTITRAGGLKDEAIRLAGACKDFPGKLPGLVKNPLEIASKGKVVGDDVKATTALPDRIQLVVDEAGGIFTDVQGAFAE